jgi:SPP1 gp7 family putative phage head morphogenesis protein
VTPDQFKALVAANRSKLGRKLPRQLPPTRIANSYTKAIQSLMVSVYREVQKRLIPLLPGLTAQASRVATTDAAGSDVVGVTIDELRQESERLFSRARLARLAEPTAQDTQRFQAAQLNRQLAEVVTVDVVGTAAPWLDETIDEFTRENVALIKTIPSRFFDEIETTIRRESADGARWEDIAESIAERYDVSRSRSRLIARDQVGKFYGDLNRVRQGDLGITRFVWRTVRDNRVREEHQELDGEVFTWGEAPEGGPGEAVLCRCYADPVIESAI